MIKVQQLPLSDLKPWPRNARTHSRKQVKQLAESIKKFGFTQPVLIDEDNRILAGHGRVSAAAYLGYLEVPCIRVPHLSEAQRRAYVLADNKLALNSGWDRKLLAEELTDLQFLSKELSFDVDVTGFSLSERDKLAIAGPVDIAADRPDDGGASVPARCRPGDIFKLGQHWLICSDELHGSTVEHLQGDERPIVLMAVPCDTDAKIGPQWSESTLISAENAGGFIFLSESDPVRCDRIIHGWETRTRKSAVRHDDEPVVDEDGDDPADDVETPEVPA